MPLTRIQPYYFWPTDDLAQNAVTVDASAEDAEFLAENLVLRPQGRPAKLTTTSGWFRLEFSAAIQVYAAAIIGHTYDEGLEVFIEGNTTGDFTSPAFSQSHTMGAPLIDRSAQSLTNYTRNPLIVFDAAQSYKWWRLYTSSANSVVPAVGQLLLFGTTRRVDLMLDDDMGESYLPTQIDHQLIGADHVTALIGPRRSLTAALVGTDYEAGSTPVQDADDFRQLVITADGRALPFFLVPFEVADGWYGRFAQPSVQRRHRKGGYQRWDLEFIEEARTVPYP